MHLLKEAIYSYTIGWVDCNLIRNILSQSSEIRSLKFIANIHYLPELTLLFLTVPGYFVIKNSVYFEKGLPEWTQYFSDEMSIDSTPTLIKLTNTFL